MRLDSILLEVCRLLVSNHHSPDTEPNGYVDRDALGTAEVMRKKIHSVIAGNDGI